MLIEDGLELLTEPQCEELLSARTLGRIGVTIGGLPAILPVNYVYVDHSVVFRTSDGAKLRAANRNTVVAFEIDGYDAVSRAGWSVLVIGRAAEIASEEADMAFDEGQLMPWVRGSKQHYVRVRPELISGRRIVD